MAEIQEINVGAIANDGTGASLRAAMTIANANFTELDTRTNHPSCYLGFGNVAIPNASVHQLVDADLSTDTDSDGLWDDSNSRILVPAGYTGILIVFDGGLPGASSGGFDYSIEVRKNGATSTGSTAEPTAWSNTQGTAGLGGGGNDVASLVIRDVCTTADYYTFWFLHDKGSSGNAVGNVYVELIP